MTNSVLFTPKAMGTIVSPNRIVMAPMTRSRTAQPGDIPTDLMATYYAQRASAGFIITEATQISKQGKGYSFTPGMYSEEHVNGWRKVTNAVHAAEGRIFSQLWHVGRMSHESLHEDGTPVAPSALSPDAQVWIVGDDGVGRMLDCPIPRALSNDDIKDIIDDYRHTAKNAIEAGFDGIEIHAGNGYLIDQFLRRSSNKRDDEYGGSIENRIRFAVEIIDAVSHEIGADKVGIRLAPFITQRGMNDTQVIDAILLAAKLFNDLGIAYIHLSEADWDDAPAVSDSFRHDLRAAFNGAIIVAGNYTAESGEKIIASGLVDFVAYGRKFLANPDLPYRFKNNLPLNEITDSSTLFGGGEVGYTDFPCYTI
ncbi:N-ethylmaleimide reductase [Bathymodiolus heckerae thiotrophic gill symbiont]|uniref:alkene reductase n=1 Tax=Bathymodiolus heckerae thiotrophic gill symbiont TaxID=1052212 RepID=UPI0010B80744|nr:alkene reductase [Bathymodiolus heckerae thiotrophic gill symbiont]SHN93161.1 N-ethylmaleimide reductase [Bathymodiolus heckerae thiotrophic gill symbiont]